MLIARAPMRISLAGGGTDFPAYFREHGGLVVSTSIDRYFYAFVRLNSGESVQITSSDYRMLFRQRRGEPILWDGDLALPRAFLDHFGIDAGLSIFLASEVPPGTGLGSSSAAAVSLAKALSGLAGMSRTREQLAQLAAHIEIEKLGFPIGYQDQYAAAYGGLNAIYFTRDGVVVEPLGLPPTVERTLERRLMLFFTGSSRNSAAILREQHAASERGEPAVIASLHRIRESAERTLTLLRSGDLDGYGSLLDQSWQAKKRLAQGVSNPRIDEWYELARQNGAAGGKIAGAGGGGFLLLYCREESQDAVATALERRGLVRMDFAFEQGGAMLLMDAMPHTRSFGRAVASGVGRVSP
jgi:D-glycero-alpha-D-manno-heptose-7-phosphate kinase